MTDIVKIICTDIFEDNPRHLVTGIRPDQTFYFENDYTCIPNEFGLAPKYFPKMIFTAIIGCLDALISNHVENPDVRYYHWYFSVFYRNSQQKSFCFTEAEISHYASELKKFLYYNDFLDDYHRKLDDKRFLVTSTSVITLQNTRGQIAKGYVLLDEFFERCSSTYNKADFNSANYTMSYEEDGSLIFELKNDAKENLTVKINADGFIQSDGCIPYIGLLKQKGVRVISPQCDTSKDVMPFMTADDYIKYHDPRYLLSLSEQSFSFENEEEYETFLKYYQSSGKVEWLKDDEYAALYKLAYKNVGNRKFSEALLQLQDCLVINPIAIAARFEMVNCYIGLKNYAEAKKCLVILSRLIKDDEDKAKLYRLFGYIFMEEKEYPAAYVCYRQSLEVCYTKNEYAIQQMIWAEKTERELQEKRKPYKQYTVQWWQDIESSLKYYRIPFLKRW